MTCHQLRESGLLERYLIGDLSEEERETLESHYFGCGDCFAELEACRAVQSDLRSRAEAIRAEPIRRPSSWVSWGAPLAIAAVVLLAIILLRNGTPVAQPAAPSTKAPDYTVLARLDPPAYTAPLRRGVEGKASARFLRAMQAYGKQDYAATVDGLQASLALDSKAIAPRFFLGSCYLLTGDWAQGTRELQQVVDAGDTPFRDESRMLLAEAELHRNDGAAARKDLEPVAAGSGDLSAAARDLMARIDAVRSAR